MLIIFSNLTIAADKYLIIYDCADDQNYIHLTTHIP